MELEALRFIGEPIEVEFEEAPALEKVPDCPDRFVWRGEVYQVVEKLGEWHDYRRRGNMGRNMAPRHLQTARRRGSWGVGRDYFRVRTEVAGSSQQSAVSHSLMPVKRGRTAGGETLGTQQSADSLADKRRGSHSEQLAVSPEADSSRDRVFDLYYDRAPSAGGRKGGWFLYQELRCELEGR